MSFADNNWERKISFPGYKMYMNSIQAQICLNNFRTFEEKATLDVLKKKNTVIALGGGAFLNTNIRREILINHLSFWLKLDTKTLINRIIKSSKRPIAFKSSKSELAEMINNRNKLYSKALFKVDCNNLTKIKIVNNILNIYDDQETIC